MSDRRVVSQYHSLVIILIFSKQFLRPRQSGAYGTCHACHTLDTPLTTTINTFQNLSMEAVFLCIR